MRNYVRTHLRIDARTQPRAHASAHLRQHADTRARPYSRKGGVGKTTISGHLAVEAERTGHGPVALIDTDEQGNLADWWNARQAPTPLFARADIASLGTALQGLRQQGVRLVIIDTPPGLTSSPA